MNRTPTPPDRGDVTTFQGFQNLMRLRIRDVLLVSSMYDSYLFEEDGRLYELIRNEYQGLNISHSPEMTRVSSGHEAIARAKEEKRFDLIITTLHIEDMHPLQFARAVRAAGLSTPVVLLAFDNRELAELMARHDTSVFDRIFIWQGDYRLLIAIIKHFEDRINVEHDSRTAGVQSIILIEDNIRFYSSFLPLIYTEILNQSQRLIAEGFNLPHRYVRMRARPKILLSTTYEEAWGFFEKYRENILGVISDVDFYRGGKPDPQAGIAFARNVKAQLADIPILLQSTSPENESRAAAAGASFVLKDSPMLLNELRSFMTTYFSFGDFVFRLPGGREVGRASDLASLEEQIASVPGESLMYHGARNHFSNWLKARTEFWLAHRLRPRRISDYAGEADLRADLVRSLSEYRRMQQRGTITDFVPAAFDPSSSFARIGGGSLGGKARGLGFLNILLTNFGVPERFPGVFVPPGVVVGTDVFDRFLDDNGLRAFAVNAEAPDEEIAARFLAAEKFPEEVVRGLAQFLEIVREPLAVRSSSLLEDSQYQPFAGVYATYMIPNNNPDLQIRLAELIAAIRRVFASTFYRSAREYIRMTSYRLEEEKMAVVIQKLVGSKRGSRFYPSFAGVAKSYNFYPSPPQTPADGIAATALGLGKTVVDGGAAVRFCPKFPGHLPHFTAGEDAFAHNQHEFFALDLAADPDPQSTADTLTRAFPLSAAEEDGTLGIVGSTYSPDNDAVTDGIARRGVRLVTFAPILKNKSFPLAGILDLLLDLGSGGMGSPVEIEFAVDLPAGESEPASFGVLQMRPLVVNREFEEMNLDKIPQKEILCSSGRVLGNGIIEGIRDIVYVDIKTFDRGKSHDVALEVGQINARLAAEHRPYLLIGVGRWGTLDPWLGIPVRWEQISGARAIVESGFRDFTVTPSEGSHFFQNLTAFMVGYFTVNEGEHGTIDWEWLRSRKPCEAKTYTKHIRLDAPLVVRMDGHRNRGVILKR